MKNNIKSTFQNNGDWAQSQFPNPHMIFFKYINILYIINDLKIVNIYIFYFIICIK